MTLIVDYDDPLDYYAQFETKELERWAREFQREEEERQAELNDVIRRRAAIAAVLAAREEK